MSEGIIKLVGFLDHPDEVRKHALSSTYVDWKGYDNQVYKRVSIVDVPNLKEKIQKHIGPVDMLGMGYRLNYANEFPNKTIHTDVGWGTHALVLYLSENTASGTAFWKHIATGKDSMEHDDIHTYLEVRNDWDDDTKWKMVDYVPSVFNTAIIYPSKLFHSRYPFEAYGSTPEDGRLIAIAFFTPKT